MSNWIHALIALIIISLEIKISNHLCLEGKHLCLPFTSPPSLKQWGQGTRSTGIRGGSRPIRPTLTSQPSKDMLRYVVWQHPSEVHQTTYSSLAYEILPYSWGRNERSDLIARVHNRILHGAVSFIFSLSCCHFLPTIFSSPRPQQMIFISPKKILPFFF